MPGVTVSSRGRVRVRVPVAFDVLLPARHAAGEHFDHSDHPPNSHGGLHARVLHDADSVSATLQAPPDTGGSSLSTTVHTTHQMRGGVRFNITTPHKDDPATIRTSHPQLPHRT